MSASACATRPAWSGRGAPRGAWAGSGSRASAIAIRGSCPAASASAWRSGAPSRPIPRCCCSTSRCPRWTCPCGGGGPARSARGPALVRHGEPLSALDLPLRRALRDELRTILTAWGTAAVLVPHDFTEAYRLGDRIVVYEDGRVIQAAPRAELLWQPASRAVARVMGLVNVLEGTVLKASPDRIQFRWRGQGPEG